MAASTTGVIQNVMDALRPNSPPKGVTSNRAYQLIIEVTGEMEGLGNGIFPVIANLPERYHMEMGSNWEMPFAKYGAGDIAAGAIGGQRGAAVGEAVTAGASAMGVGTKARAQTFQTWESSTPVQMNFDLIFYAHESTEREIRMRHLALMKLVAPSGGGPGNQILKSPGPTLLGEVVGGRKVSVFVGNYLTFENVVVNSVGSDVVTLLDKNGIPIGMSINFSFTTWNSCVTTEDLDQIFGVGGANG